ncbi:MAG: hypothetical protein MnENMB40S_21750 [Rhizobiaceae bacterium MnEN-MB40S]|nr:MAG: hypothetical protein MnENMB40S_21750 [Rhizobiaceae bacterium MnEN-MB40S]
MAQRILSRLFLLIVLTAPLTGCVNYLYSGTPVDFSSNSLKPNEGFVFMSLVQGQHWNVNAIYSFYFRNEADGGIGKITYTPGLLGNEKTIRNKAANEKGTVKSYTLPAGQYHFYKFSIIQGQYGGYRDWEPREEFSIPFTVRPGRATYIGEITMSPVIGRSLFGLPVLAGGVFTISSNPGRDIPLFTEKFPKINPQIIVQDPMRSGDAPPEIVRFR